MLSKQAIDFIKNNFKTGNLVCMTGGGISAQSGIPALQEKLGLWQKYRPEIYATTMGLVSTFQTSPEKIVDFLNDFYPLLIKAKPNPAHFTLAAMQKQGVLKTLITQNVDGLHQQAGSRSVVELQGNAYRIRCMDCSKIITLERDRIEEMINLLKVNRKSIVQLLRVLSRYFPKCACLGRFRIDVALFGEMLPKDALKEAYQKLDNCDIFFLIGTSLAVQSIAALPAYAKQRGAKIIEISSEPQGINCDLRITGDISSVLPQVFNIL